MDPDSELLSCANKCVCVNMSKLSEIFWSVFYGSWDFYYLVLIYYYNTGWYNGKGIIGR